MCADDDASTLIEVDNTSEGKREMVDQIQALLDKVLENTDAADDKSKLRLRIFTKKC